MENTTFNIKKFKTLVHYICYMARDPSALGAIRLNKVLWYSDTTSYIQLKKPITGETYIKRQYGPVPKHIVQAISELVKSGDIVTREINYNGRMMREHIALTKPDISIFTPEEISLVDEIFEFVCKHKAIDISNKTHDEIWELAVIGEEIPYHTVFASKLGEITEEDIAWAKRELGNVTK